MRDISSQGSLVLRVGGRIASTYTGHSRTVIHLFSRVCMIPGSSRWSLGIRRIYFNAASHT